MRDFMDIAHDLLWILLILFICLCFIGECIRLASVIVGHPIDMGPITITGDYVQLR